MWMRGHCIRVHVAPLHSSSRIFTRTLLPTSSTTVLIRSVGARAEGRRRERGRAAGRGQVRRRWHRPTGWGCTSSRPPSGAWTSPAEPPLTCGSGTAENARRSEALWCAPPVGTRRPAGRFFCAGQRPASRPVQDPDLDSLRLCNPLQGYHWLELVRQSCMTSRSATRRFRAWHSCPERELLPFRPLLQHRRLDGKPPVQGLLERDSRSGSRSSVHCSDDPAAHADSRRSAGQEHQPTGSELDCNPHPRVTVCIQASSSSPSSSCALAGVTLYSENGKMDVWGLRSVQASAGFRIQV